MGHDLHVAHVEFQKGDRAAMQAAWGADKFHHVPYRRPWKKHRLRGLGLPIPDRWAGSLVRCGWACHRVDHFFDDGALPLLAAIHERHRFDGVMVEYVSFSRALAAFPNGVVKILDTHDVFGGRGRLYRQVGLAPEWFYTTPGEELKGLLRADRIAAIQNEDGAIFERLLKGRRPVFRIGHFLAPANEPAGPTEPRLGFFGSENMLNRDGLHWFAKAVWPGMRATFPNHTLTVWGTVSPAVPRSAGIFVAGPVADAREPYQQASIFINPMRTGTGLKIKSLEALAHGAALAASPPGMAGLEKAIGQGAFRLETPAQWQECLSRLLTDRALLDSCREKALGFAKEYQDEQFAALAALIGQPAGRSG